MSVVGVQKVTRSMVLGCEASQMVPKHVLAWCLQVCASWTLWFFFLIAICDCVMYCLDEDIKDRNHGDYDIYQSHIGKIHDY